jgi:hypothetical protein
MTQIPKAWLHPVFDRRPVERDEHDPSLALLSVGRRERDTEK